MFGQWRPCFLRYANVLIVFCSPLNRDTVYQISSRSDHQLPWNSFFWVLAPPTGKSAHLFFLTKDLCHLHCVSSLVEDISFCSRAIIFSVTWALDFRTFLGPHCNIAWKCQLFSIIIDIHFPENILQWFWIRSGTKPRTSCKSTFQDIPQVCEKTGPRRPPITGGFSIFPDPRIPNVKILSLRPRGLGLYSTFAFFLLVAPLWAIWLRIWYVLLKLRATHWQSFKSLGLTVWAARCVLRRKNNNNNNKILTITIGILQLRARTPNKNLNNYNRDSALRAEPLIKAASSIKRGSCFEGIRVCFYGLGQPWFIADSETHRKWTTGWQKTHTQTHVQLFIDNYWSRES